ncbi:MAG: ComEC/Rec2 family competence protein [Saprospiraceae bacterium]
MFPKVNWRAIPFIRLTIPLILGIWCNNQVEQSLPFPILILGVLLLISFLVIKIKFNYYQQWIVGVWLNIVLFLLGWQLIFWNNDSIYDTHYQQFIQQKTELSKYWVIGEIINIPTTKNTTKIELSIKKIGINQDSLTSVFGKILCYVEADSLAKKLNYGEKILFQSFINEVELPKNPHQFDYKQFLKYKKIHYQTYLKTGSWQRLDNENKGLFYAINKIRASRIKQIKTYLKGEAEQGVAMALLLGFKDELSEDIKAAYSETGAIHVLAVSGLHVGIIAMILRWLLKRFRWRRKWLKLMMMIFPLWFYALLTGFSPSVIRATVMFSLLVLGLEMDKKPNIYNVLAASALVLLLIDPYFLFSVGFQLSYAAVFGIVYFQPKIAIWYLPKYKFINYFWQLTTVSIAATLGTLPFTLYYFHQFPVWFWLSSAIVIPAAAVILSVGLAFFTFGSLPFLGNLIGQLLEWIIWLMNVLINKIHALPFSLIKGLWFSSWEFYVLLIAILGFGLLLQTRRIRWLLFSLSLVLLLAIFSFYNDWQSSKQKEVVIYSLSNATAIDFINGRKVTTLQSENLTIKNYEFAAQTHHYQRNIKIVDSLNINKNITQNNLIKSNNLIQFYDKTFLIIDNKNIVSREKLELDYLIISNSPRLKIADLNQYFDFKMLIFDSSNKYWQIKNWKTECEELEIDYQDVRNDYAFVLSF